MHSNDNKIDGPALLYHLLCKCTDTVESDIRIYQDSPNNLQDKLEEFRYNINKFCNYAAETFKSFKDTGGNGKNASLKL
eukprot:1841146-Ditylum_brightwellii.AAC.1